MTGSRRVRNLHRMNSLYQMNRKGEPPFKIMYSAEFGALTNSPDDGMSSDEKSSPDEFPSSGESFEQGA